VVVEEVVRVSVDVVVVLLMIVVAALCLHDVWRGHRRRAAKAGTATGPAATRPAQHRQLLPGGSVEVVSGPALQGALAAAAAAPGKVLDAALVPSSDDTADAAVRVEIGGQLMGHLDAELGQRYRTALLAVPGGGAWGSCAARVEGGADRTPVLVLDLADPEVAVPAA
jgi:hypothetical protein